MNKIFNKSSIIFGSLLCYFLLTSVLIVINKPDLFLNHNILINRGVFLVLFLVSYYLKKQIKPKYWSLITVLLFCITLSALYKETGLLNEMFQPEIDDKLMVLEKKIWGFQPALIFSEIFNNAWFSELMFFGYFSYYLMPVTALFIAFIKDHNKIEEFGFVLVTSFLIYYSLYIIIPAFGPQFYLSYPENYIEAQGIFGEIIKFIQDNGEAKTAAFPSSHVGVSVIIILWMRDQFNKVFLYFIPTTILLILATVYIKAHYTVDVFAGLITAPVIYFIVKKIFKKI